MPQLIDTSAEFGTSDYFPRKRWTAAECERLVSDGLLDGAKFELIEGDIVPKMGQGRLHVIVVTRLIALLSAIFGIDFVQIQAPVGIGEIQETSDPEPDIAVLQNEVRSYGKDSPNPARDVRLAVEAAFTSLRGDLSIKARLYAEAGIPEYWVVDIKGRQLIVFRQPNTEGYSEQLTYSESDSVSPLSAPKASVLVSDILP
jgi:Uma2 family endonuclease